MIYTVPWLPSVALLGVFLFFVIVPIVAVVALLAAVLAALAVSAAFAAAVVASPYLAVRAARRRWPRLGHGLAASAATPGSAAAPQLRPAPLVNPRLHQVR